ncbi:V-type ATP synthase subunit D [Halioxenophilus aromaticivorans]|uniref:V-type ATP synthase subunit D n=1 Tax=Halioxenophilus aromaticivorans TaxID=1306992 RepID=A0AAV3U4H4_9ALTE
MARLLLSKHTLASERKKLMAYQRFLPALDLKRQQLRQAQKQCQIEYDALCRELEEVMATVKNQLPMLSALRFSISDLVSVGQVSVESRSQMGVILPHVVEYGATVIPRPPMVNAPWLGYLQQQLLTAIQLRVALKVKKQQLVLLRAAVVKTTQRVNLFDNVLIPRTSSNIKRIQVYLGDREREAVVAAKIAKRRRALPDPMP